MPPPPARDDSSRADGRQTFERLEGEEVARATPPVRAAAANDGQDRRVFIGNRLRNRPSFVTDSYDIASSWSGCSHCATRGAETVPNVKPPVLRGAAFGRWRKLQCARSGRTAGTAYSGIRAQGSDSEGTTRLSA